MTDFHQNKFTVNFKYQAYKLKAAGKFKSFSELADKIEYSKTSLSDVINGRRNIPVEIIANFCKQYDVNINTIMPPSDIEPNAVQLEEYEPTPPKNRPLDRIIEYKSGKKETEFLEIGNGQYVMLVPLVEEYAQAGYLAGFSDEEYVSELPKTPLVVDKFHKGKYLSFRVTGDSMHDGSSDSISDGDIVTGREIQKHLWNSRFHLHKFKDFIIVHKEGVLIKRITKHDVEKGIISCRSLNPDKDTYPDFELFLKDISQIMNIVNVTKSR